MPKGDIIVHIGAMRDHAIVPTAQRLAEENNVDWRVLTGSGEGGSVVERDVLGYLARVMRGEEATNPTPEPLPEGLSAWPEEPERRRNTADRGASAKGTSSAASRASVTTRTENRLTEQPSSPESWSESQGASHADRFTPFTAPPPVTVTNPKPETESHAPWTVEKPVKAALETPVAARDFLQADAAVSEPMSKSASPTAAAGVSNFVQSGAETPAVGFAPEIMPETPVPEASAAPPKEEVSEAYRAALAELETLQARVSELEEERSKHVNELHQLSRMQETIALQKNEGAKVGALQSEVRDLKAQLAAAQRAGERVETLAAHNRDLEARLVRARTFKSQAKAEFERILEDNMMLEHELADLKRARRGLFRKG